MKAKQDYKEFKDRLYFRKFCREKDKEFREIGFSKAMWNYLNFTKTRFREPIWDVTDIESTKDILANKPVFVIANHNYNAELLALIGAFPPRDDTYVYAISEMLGMGNNIAEHILPAYVSEHLINSSKKMSIRIGRHWRFGPRYTTREAYRNNLASLEKSAGKLKNGHMIIMFPDGVRESYEEWSSAVGRILIQLKDTQEDIYLVRVYAFGTSVFDFLRRFKGIGKILPVMQTCIGEPLKVSDLLARESHPNKLTRLVQDEYREWKKRALVYRR